VPVTDGGGLAVASDDQGSDPAVSGDQAPHGELARHGVELDPEGHVKQVFFLDEDSPEPLYLQVALLIGTGAGICFPALMTLAMSGATPRTRGSPRAW
jgi:hypothetical protein